MLSPVYLKEDWFQTLVLMHVLLFSIVKDRDKNFYDI